MEQLIIEHDTDIRLLVFAGVLLMLLILEYLFPKRLPGQHWQRRLNNLGLLGVDVLAVRILIPFAIVAIAAICVEKQWGILNQVDIDLWLSIIISVVVLDLAIYLQHVVLHYVGFLWRIHKVHHTDIHFDVTTAIRFHPLEILLSTLYKTVIVFILGPPVVAVIIFETLLFSSAMFNHSNLALPVSVDRWLRYLIVTPDMHRVHHSVIKRETNSNYGFFIPWWDHLYKTYRQQPEAGHTEMKIGLNEIRDRRSIDLKWLLAQPFIKVDNSYNEEQL